MTLRLSGSVSALRTLLPLACCLLVLPAALSQTPAKPAATTPNRSAAYYHEGLAHLYEELAVSNGRQDYASQAVEEYKLALSADPDNPYLQDGLPELYFKIGRIREAVTAAQDQVKKNPDDAAAHTLLGKVYLRSLNDMQGPQANEMLTLAIGEYEKLVQLEPKNLEDHLLLGQLYSVNHDSAKAEAQFKIAQSLDGNSEDAVLNIARLYSEQGELQRAADTLNAIPASERSARISFTLGQIYDQLKQPKKAADAYKAALEDEPDNPDTQHALATTLLNDNRLDDAMQAYQQILLTDPTDANAQMKISEIQRRQGHYDQALLSLNKARELNGKQDNLELSFQEAVLYDSLGKYDQAVAVLQQVLSSTARTDGKYSDPERSNRAIFLDRLGIVYREQNKTADAISTYKQMVDLGGDSTLRGYQGEVDTYRDAHQFKDAVAVAAEAAKALPKDHSVQLMYAFQLADIGQADQGIALANAQLTGKPEDRDVYIALANIDLRLRRYPDALAQLDKAAKLTTQPTERMYLALLRATVYDKDKNYDAAEAQYKAALAIDPDNANVLNDFGFMYADRGVNLPQALTMIKRAVELDPQNGAYLDSLGWVYYKLDQYGPAEDNLHKAIDRTPTDPSIHDHLGEVYDKTGRLKLAVAQWERSMTEYAHSLPADADPSEIARVKRKLDDARIKLARVNTTPAKKS